MSRLQNPNGVLVVDKPGGMTSAQVVSRVKYALGLKKIGHTGTLDPMATGVLPLCIGEGTKIAGYLLAEDKSYEGELVLGSETDTLDAEGQVTASNPEAAQTVTEAQILAVMDTFRGPISQVPPMYSALKKDGRRLHQLARAGKEVERPPRDIIVHTYELLSFSAGRARFFVKASKGTYVRSLVFDLGRKLGCGAHLTALRRTQSGRFGLTEAISLQEIIGEDASSDISVVDPAVAIDHLRQITVPESALLDIADGKRVPWQVLEVGSKPTGVFALLCPGNRALLAIAEVDGESLRYRRVFNYGLPRSL